MASVMLEVLQEVTDPYGPALPLAEKIEGGHVPDNQLEAVPERWAARRSKIVRPAHQDGYDPYIPDPFRSAALAVVGTNLVLDFASREETEHDVRALGHHLLYADSVALSDPIPEIFDESYFTSENLPKRYSTTGEHVSRTSLASSLPSTRSLKIKLWRS